MDPPMALSAVPEDLNSVAAESEEPEEEIAVSETLSTPLPPKTPTPPPLPPDPSAGELARRALQCQLLDMRNIVPLLVGYVTNEADQLPCDENGRWHGTGVVHFQRGQRYEGELQHGLLEGQGTMTWPDGTQYKGQFRQNAISGYGTYTWPSRCQYTGEVCCGRQHGTGEFSHPNGYRYVGEWQHGAKHGRGRMVFGSEKNSTYDGEWQDNMRQGEGERIYPSGNNYIGQWTGGRRHGIGKMIWYRWHYYQETYDGEWKEGLQDGEGTHVWRMHQLDPVQHPRYNSYTGEFRKGDRHGQGVFQYASDATFSGSWKNNLKMGTGVYTDVVQEKTTQDFIDDKVMYVCQGREDDSGVMMCVAGELRDFEHLLKPTYQLDMRPLLENLPEMDQKIIKDQVWTVLRRHISELRRIYSYYAGLGTEDLSAPDYLAMTQLQWWQMMRDCDVHLSGLPAQVLMGIPMLSCGTAHPLDVVHFHEYLLMFLLLADVLYTSEQDWQLAERVGRFLEQVVLVRDSRSVSGLTLTLPLSQRPQPPQLELLYQEFQRQAPTTVRSTVRALGNGRVPDMPCVRPAVMLRAARQVVPLMVMDGHLDMELELTFIDFCELLLVSRQLHAEQRPPRAERPPRTHRRPRRQLYEVVVPTYALLQYRHRLVTALRELAAPAPKKSPAAKAAAAAAAAAAKAAASKKADKTKSSTASQLASKDREKERSSVKMGRKS